MTTPTQAEKCRVIAEWLGWRVLSRKKGQLDTVMYQLQYRSTIKTERGDASCHGTNGVSDALRWCRTEQRAWTEVPNFFKSEDASALIRHKAGISLVFYCDEYFAFTNIGSISCDGVFSSFAIKDAVRNADDKTAVADFGYRVAMAERAAKEKLE